MTEESKKRMEKLEDAWKKKGWMHFCYALKQCFRKEECWKYMG